MSLQPVTAANLRPYLEQCGYTGSRLAQDYRFEDGTVPLVGFHGAPWDARSACLAAVDADGESRTAATTCQSLGAPAVLVCQSGGFDFWTIAGDGPTNPKHVTAKEFESFFRKHRDDLAPQAIYDAKMRRPIAAQRQLWFVDAGLMPAVERRAGEDLHRLVEGAVQDLSATLASKLRSRKAFEDLYKTVFWLLAAKLLHEKRVDKFVRIDLTDVDEVFRRVGRHYAETDDLPPGGDAWRPAVEKAAADIASWGHLGNISAEALGYLYERALIDKKPKSAHAKKLAKGRDIRKELGIHSTPPVLVDHMLAQLWPLIEQINPTDRRVFEPACGHAAFLVAALRWLREYSDVPEGIQRHRYLRDRLHGVEIEPFARELGKLSLTLADVPHGNSWRIDQADMFEPDVLKRATSRCMILLANPPYEAFTSVDRASYQKAGEPVATTTKAAEMLTRTLSSLSPGAVFGVVVPQGLLHKPEAALVRGGLISEFELIEVSLFADNLFDQSDHETAVLLGRRGKLPGSSRVSYRRVREPGMDAFKQRLAFSSERSVAQERFLAAPDFDLRVPDAEEVWTFLAEYPRLSSVATAGQGFSFEGKDLPDGVETLANKRRKGWRPCVVSSRGSAPIYGLPAKMWMNPAKDVIQRSRAGLAGEKGQLLVNHSRGGRGSWSMKAWIDFEGLAVKGNFLVVRPTSKFAPSVFLWAVLNSPLANGYVYCHASKRHIIGGDLLDLPIPPLESVGVGGVIAAAKTYMASMERTDQFFEPDPLPSDIRQALLKMDAEVLKLYDLPPRLERQLLDLFQGVERRGVGCEFRGYYPPGLDAYVPLHELISDDYARSTLEVFRKREPLEQSSPVLAALRKASEVFGED